MKRFTSGRIPFPSRRLPAALLFAVGGVLMLALAPAGKGWAQEVLEEWEEESDYEMYFGDTEPERDKGPADLTEALKQRRGYRIGGHGRYNRRVQPQRDVHTVAEGDTLWGIAERYYQDPWQWPRLWSYNPEITNPHWIYPLDQVRLSAETLKQDQAVVAGSTTGPQLAAPTGDIGSAGAVVVPRRLFKPGMVFLRDQGYLDRDALKTAGVVIGGNEEQMLMAHTDELYVRFAKGADVRAGQEYAIFREMTPVERNSNEKGQLVRIFGTVTVRSYDRDKRIARGVVSESLDPVERGYRVAKVERRFELVPPKRNEANVVARVIASLRPRTLISSQDVVFLDVGRSEGVKPGNRFFVIRRGDRYLDAVRGGHAFVGPVDLPETDREDFPKEVVAELRVVKVRKETTIALVTRSDIDVAYGDVAEMRAGF